MADDPSEYNNNLHWSPNCTASS